MLRSKVRERERDRHLEKMHHRKPLQFWCSKQTYSPNSQKSAKKIHTIICKKKVSRIIGIISAITLSSKQTRKHASVFLSVSLSHHYCWQLPSYVKTPSWLLWAHFYGPRLVSDVCFWPLFRTLSTDFRKVLKSTPFPWDLGNCSFPFWRRLPSFSLGSLFVCLSVAVVTISVAATSMRKDFRCKFSQEESEDDGYDGNSTKTLHDDPESWTSRFLSLTPVLSSFLCARLVLVTTASWHMLVLCISWGSKVSKFGESLLLFSVIFVKRRVKFSVCRILLLLSMFGQFLFPLFWSNLYLRSGWMLECGGVYNSKDATTYVVIIIIIISRYG